MAIGLNWGSLRLYTIVKSREKGSVGLCCLESLACLDGSQSGLVEVTATKMKMRSVRFVPQNAETTVHSVHPILVIPAMTWRESSRTSFATPYGVRR